jgi:hypothetical protein
MGERKFPTPRLGRVPPRYDNRNVLLQNSKRTSGILLIVPSCPGPRTLRLLSKKMARTPSGYGSSELWRSQIEVEIRPQSSASSYLRNVTLRLQGPP